MPKPIKFGYNNVNRNTLKLAITPVSRDPAACPMYYEFSFTIHTLQGGLPVDEFAGFIFRDNQNVEPGGRVPSS